MPRDVSSGLVSWPAGTTAVAGTVIEAAKYNAFTTDLKTILNTAQPINMGGTGAVTAAAARTALSVPLNSETTGEVESIAALRLLTAMFVPSLVQVQSYYPAASYTNGITRGRAVYRYDSADGSTADDNVLCIVDAASRRWKLCHEGTITLGQCGAYVDGSTDDLTYVNRAIAYLNSNTSGVNTVFSEPGIVALSDTPSALNKSGRSIVGYGWGASEWLMKSTAGTNGTFLIFGEESTLSLPYDGQVGNFVVGNIVTGATSGATGTVSADTNNGASGTLTLTSFSGTFQDNENLQVSGVTKAVANIPGGATVNSDKAQNMTVEGILFENDNDGSLTGGEAAIWLRNASQIIVNGCDFNGCNTAFKFGGTNEDEYAIRIFVSNCHIQPTMYNGAHLVHYLSASATHFNNCQFYGGGSTGVANSRLVAFIGSSNGEGLDNHLFSNCTWNANGTDIDYGFVFDATDAGIANVRFNGCTMDGGKEYSILFRIGATASSNNKRIFQVSFSGCRISASTDYSTEGGGGIHIDHEISNYIHAVSFDACVFTLGSKRGLYHERGGAVSLDATGFTITNCHWANNYTNADTLGTTRSVMEINGNGFVITGNRIGVQREDVDGVAGANFFTSFVKLLSGNAYKNVIKDNDVSRISNTYPVDVSALGAAGMAEGPYIGGNSGKPQGPIRTAQTTDATVTTLGQQALTNGLTYHITGKVIGVKSDDSERAMYTINAIASCAGGTATVHAGGTPTVDYESDAAWACAVDANSNNLRVRVTGKAATTIDWGLYDLVITAQ